MATPHLTLHPCWYASNECQEDPGHDLVRPMGFRLLIDCGLLSAFGWITLLHTTLEVIKYREYIEILSDEFISLPLHLMLEVAIGAVLATAGAYILAGGLRSISLSRQAKTHIDTGNYRLDFVSFHKSQQKATPIHIAPLK